MKTIDYEREKHQDIQSLDSDMKNATNLFWLPNDIIGKVTDIILDKNMSHIKTIL